MKRYIGYISKSGNSEFIGWHYFESSVIPTQELYPVYGAVIGPFKTKRAAIWALNQAGVNPHFQTVRDAERISKQKN